MASIHACVYNDFSPSRHENSTCVYNDFSPSRHENSTYVHSTRNQLADMINFVLFQTPVHLASTCSRHTGMIFCMICLVLNSVYPSLSLPVALFLCLPLSLSPSLSLSPPPPSLLPQEYTRHISCLKNIPRLRVVQTRFSCEITRNMEAKTTSGDLRKQTPIRLRKISCCVVFRRALHLLAIVSFPTCFKQTCCITTPASHSIIKFNYVNTG